MKSEEKCPHGVAANHCDICYEIDEAARWQSMVTKIADLEKALAATEDKLARKVATCNGYIDRASDLERAIEVLAAYAERGECSAICAQVCPACAKVFAMNANPIAKSAVEKAQKARTQQ